MKKKDRCKHGVHGQDCFECYPTKFSGEWYCHKCQLKRGGKVPSGPQCVTVTLGKCSMCKKKKVGLVPDCDYNWPDGRKAIFD